ncbi:LEAF RUST 10 DISEASE-RESISTANCE LOCUS RECEPTOR-LIKE PROTEIN KINASE-like 1.1 [Salvia miltiorrhiza]|uniref:LEAF RUST 10 DISEASE-RESISTANCE LOCUS RECEPTOR-LIKE PROTEIN KINASE-like 1.1 n=1 Tax=Salvia miltiorrhiza TaxID=226208 RepID=UPI0025AB65F8|nr:LEAF RUST 10 DISEASE-RESISTANCE LOCUS RECEPTOR-LIKE PROTEIN KINASE-like 1.1 [Salvia miltiorrhiza]
MKLPKYLILSLLHCLIITSTLSKCPQSYPCRNLTLKFPFTDIRNPECGLFMVDGCNSTHGLPRIQLEAQGLRYDLLQLSENNMSVRYSQLQKLFKEGTYFLLRLPKYPFSSLTIASPHINLLSCNNPHFGGNPCNCSQIPLNLFCVNLTAPKETRDSSECSMIQVPINTEPNQCSKIHLNQLNPEFTLEFNVSHDCYQCHRRGGQCFRNWINDFYCKEGSSRLVLILAISGGGLLFILCLLISYMIWLLKKRVGTGYIRSSNISFDTSKSDINGGSSFFGIPIFPYTELEAATNNFDPSRELGDGGFGTVYYGKLLDGREVAIKRLYEQNCRRVEQFMNEIEILTGLRHPNLVCLYGCTSRRSRELLLVYEYVSNGTVADHLHGERAEAAPLTWPIRMRIAIETATALAYLHKSDIIHRDVKTDNILLDENFHVKVADFGLSRLFPYDASHISTVPGGTPGYIDPEYHMCYQVTDKSDVYSFGVVLVELISSMPAVDVSRQIHEINLANFALTRIQRGAFDELVDPSLGYNLDAQVTGVTTSVAEIAFRCLQLEKEMRPSMAEVLAFLKDISN